MTPDSMVITWSLFNKQSGQFMRGNFERELTWVISICPAQYNPNHIMPWKEIYKGIGEACQISSLGEFKMPKFLCICFCTHIACIIKLLTSAKVMLLTMAKTTLEPISQYQIKVEARVRPGTRSDGPAAALSKYKIFATLPYAPKFPPIVSEWFIGASLGSIRLVGHVRNNDTKSSILPEGCLYIFELYMREVVAKPKITALSESIMHDESILGKTRSVEVKTDIVETSVFDDLFASRDAVFSGSYQPVKCAEEDVDVDAPLPEDDNYDRVSGWNVIGKCRCGKLNAIVSISAFRNPVLWLRVRVSNQDNMLSKASSATTFKLTNL